MTPAPIGQGPDQVALPAESFYSKASKAFGRAIDYFTEELLPMPEKKVKEVAKAHLPKATTAFVFASMYDSSWLINAGSSVALQKFTHEEYQQRGDREFTRQASVLLFAIHTIKAVYNVRNFWSSPSLPALSGFASDVFALFTLNNVIFDNKPLAKKD